MPLSEHEERVLAEIARQLSEEDPKFAATVAKTTPTRVLVRRLRYAVVAFVVGLLLLLGLTFHLAYGVVGFAMMLAAVLVAGGILRALGAGARDLLDELRASFGRRARRS